VPLVQVVVELGGPQQAFPQAPQLEVSLPRSVHSPRVHIVSPAGHVHPRQVTVVSSHCAVRKSHEQPVGKLGSGTHVPGMQPGWHDISGAPRTWYESWKPLSATHAGALRRDAACDRVRYEERTAG
jgi:hypothetical protein